MRKPILLASLALLTLVTAASASDLTERNKTVARRVFEEIFTQGKLEVVDELYAPDFVNHGLHGDAGLKADREATRGWRAAFPNLEMKAEKLIAEGDLVSVLWTARGTNTGNGKGLPPTGKSIEVHGVTIWRIVDGKIKEEWSAFDELAVMQQLGLLPSRKE
jgi:steroid delta-isomerase-like uncharacterized protein